MGNRKGIRPLPHTPRDYVLEQVEDEELVNRTSPEKEILKQRRWWWQIASLVSTYACSSVYAH